MTSPRPLLWCVCVASFTHHSCLPLLHLALWPFQWVSGPDSGIRQQAQRAQLSPRPGAPTLTLRRRQRAHTIPQRWSTAIPWDPQHVTRILEITQTRKQREKPFQLLSWAFLFNFPHQTTSSAAVTTRFTPGPKTGLGWPPHLLALDSVRALSQASPCTPLPPRASVSGYLACASLLGGRREEGEGGTEGGSRVAICGQRIRFKRRGSRKEETGEAEGGEETRPRTPQPRAAEHRGAGGGGKGGGGRGDKRRRRRQRQREKRAPGEQEEREEEKPPRKPRAQKGQEDGPRRGGGGGGGGKGGRGGGRAGGRAPLDAGFRVFGLTR